MTPEQKPATPPEILDVTIRDGSYVVDFQFASDDVRLLYKAIDAMGFKYIEVGHGMGLNASALKPSAASDDEHLAAALEGCTNSRFGTFFIPGIGKREHLKHAREVFGMHFVRIGNDPENLDTLFPFLEYARELGYEVMANFMKSYTVTPVRLGQMAARLAEHGAQAVYVVDSAGGMLPDEVGDYVRAIREHAGIRVGFHGHNNLELAVSNSISAWRNGATLIDCSIGGLGRSSGNTRTELLIPVLKAMGCCPPYDFHQVLSVWQKIIQPLLQRRPWRPLDVIGGYARIHSGLMKPFETAARRHTIPVEHLLEAYGNHLHAGDERPVDEIAAELGRQRATLGIIGATPAGRSLLDIPSPVADSHAIRNTFRSVDEVLGAVRVLATKSTLPVAALVSIVSEIEDDPHVMAEYCYHDEQFIVIRLSFGSIDAFVDTMQKCRGAFQILAFETGQPAIRNHVAAREADWRRGEKVYWLDPAAIKHHYLLSIVRQVAMQSGGASVLFVAGNAERLVAFLSAHGDALDCYGTSLDSGALHQVGIKPLLLARNCNRGTLPDKFDITVLLSGVNSAELLAVVRQTNPAGAIIDCVDQLALHPEILSGIPHRTLAVSLQRAFSGELLNLLHADESDVSAKRKPNAALTPAA